MASGSRINATALREFDQDYDTSREDIATQRRGEFLRAFPLKSLRNIKLANYVIGHQRPTFCAFVEARTRPWANIQGATSEKFGIYFGRTKTDPRKIYRYTRRFGETQAGAFRAVKAALLELIRLGQAADLDFPAIDANPLSQMFKAKILSLYFPNRFINICSADHLQILGAQFGYGKRRPTSEYQHLLVEAKHSNAATRNWSNPKFMSFLYDTYIQSASKPTVTVQCPTKKSHRKVNFEDVQGQRDLIGKAAEAFALEWEKLRLEGAGLGQLISKIEDRRDRPGFGYDFLSYSSQKQKRFIEVKSVGKLPRGEGHRFFLSDNEFTVSKSNDHRSSYFFYLVFFSGNGQPTVLQPIRADELYQLGEILPASYVVRFTLETP